MSKVNYHDKTAEQLLKLRDEKKAELTELRREQATDPKDDVRAVKNLKKDIARIMTIYNEKRGEE